MIAKIKSSKNLSAWISHPRLLFVLFLYAVVLTVGVFSGGAWAGLGIGGGATLFLTSFYIDKKISNPPHDMAILTTIFFVIVALLNFQSSQPAISWQESSRLLTIFVPLLLLCSPAIAKQAQHPKFFLILSTLAGLAAAALALTLYIKKPAVPDSEVILKLVKYNRGFSYLVLMAFPLMAGLWFSKNRWLIAPFLLLIFIPAGLTESRSAKLALIAGLAVILAAHFIPKAMRWLLFTSSVLATGWAFAGRKIFLDFPDLLPRIPSSWRNRIEIWDYMSYRIQEKPFLGWGLGSSHTLDFANPHGTSYIYTTLPAAHPHNVMTQLWVELGLPGLALGLAFVFLTLKKATGFDRRIVPFALGAWTACFVLSLIAYDFWTDSLFAAFAFTALAFMILPASVNSTNQSGGHHAVARRAKADG